MDPEVSGLDTGQEEELTAGWGRSTCSGEGPGFASAEHLGLTEPATLV